MSLSSLLRRLARRPQGGLDSGPEWRAEWDDLARYNAERHRGIVHTPETEARMAQIQAEYDAAWREHRERDA